MAGDSSEKASRRTVLSRRNFARTVGASGLAATAGCLGQLTGKQEWPARPVEIIAPWAAGGGADRTSRAVADAAKSHTDVSWNVSNQTGGSGSVGMNAAANAEPDGHTLGCTAPEIALFEHLGIAKLSPDDITPIMQYTEFPAALVVKKDSQFKSLDDWISYGKKNKLKMANSGFGSSWHMAAAAIADEAGVKVEHISYDGAAPAMTAVANGEVDCTAVGAAEVAPQVKDGKLTALGVAFDKKVKSLPNTPTLASQGLDIRIGSWLAHFAPPELSEDRQKKIVDVYNSVYEDKAFKEFMSNNGFIRVKRGPKELKKFLDEQYKYYGNLVDKLGIKKQ
ncbi:MULTISPECIES: Bug family tripartite tricarboxylate transporter substrate binding protein [Halorussus]|uniref:Bug family tripartite tricarboxylate transporter substrate binding protein n=1 Tax=Halorussus TaxID=1070314 RepID=UPI00209CAA3A|nr:tripartite tricarboxylate transporter substrate-binding protein [Halorussus vallis]USZ74990.1 tripartite tricarboxylate transporter substrate binding protein [Halorussus vallis]